MTREQRYRIVVEVPLRAEERAGEGFYESLFETIADAAHEWEPKDRDGWDVDVYGKVVTVEDDSRG